METKFTKGEWKIVDTDVVAENGCAICQVYDASESNITEMDMEIVLANLKLIAAAPDMFEALSAMIRIKDIYMPNDINEVKPEHYDEMNTLCKAFRQMEKAIKRVTDIHFSINAPLIKVKLEFDGKVVSGSVPENKVEDFIRKAFEDMEKENPRLSVGVHTDNMKMFNGTSNFSATNGSSSKTEDSSKKEIKKEVLDGINKRWYDLVFLPIAPFFHFTGLRPARPFIAGEGLLTEEKREQFIKVFGKKAKGEKLDFNSDFELCPSYLRGSPVQFFINARTQEIDWEKTKEFYELWKKDKEKETNSKLNICPFDTIEKLRSSNEILKSLLFLFGDRMATSTKFGVSRQISENEEVIKKAIE